MHTPLGSGSQPVPFGPRSRTGHEPASNREVPWTFAACTPGRKGVLDLARRVAPSSCAVLILGPTGVGKEVLANDIHRHNSRASGPFISVNCATAASSLFESEFFGHVKGSFTGATADKPGLVELAHGGTLFLDEVGELPLDAQAKLLRFLAQGTYWPVGATRERRADVRVIAATHRRIEGMLGGAFREDLYYRLSVVVVDIPPLEPRDIHVLARSLAEEAMARHDSALSGPELDRLASCCAERTWPGGVRELRNAVERLLVLRDPSRSVEEHCAELLGFHAGATQRCARVELSDTGKHLDDLVFLGIARECNDVRELSQRTDRTVQAVYGRLRKLGLGPRDVGPTPALNAALRRAQRRVEPTLPWLHALFTR